jgi:hypothetical protein
MAGKFFPVDREVLFQLFAHFREEEWLEPIFAYLVLCKHQQRGKPYTTAGALAIGKVLGITRYRAEELIRELKKVRWGVAPHEQILVTPQVLQDHLEISIPNFVGLFSVKGLPRMGSDCLYLPNCLFEGTNGKPSHIQDLKKIPSRLDQFDALSLLLHCYAFHDVEGSGGLDPRRTFYAPWCHEGSCLEDELELGYQGKQNDGRSDWHFWLVSKANELKAQKSFIETVTEGDSERFFQAVRHLKELGFLIEVAMVFDRDPLASPSAEPLYPLRVFDALYRQNAKKLDNGTGGLYGETFNCLDRSGQMAETVDLRYAIFGPYCEGIGEPSGFYVVAGTVKTATVLSVYRLRFCPHDRDTGIGFQAEADRAGHWKERLSQAFH